MSVIVLKTICLLAALFGACIVLFAWIAHARGYFDTMGVATATLKIGGTVLRGCLSDPLCVGRMAASATSGVVRVGCILCFRFQRRRGSGTRTRIRRWLQKLDANLLRGRIRPRALRFRRLAAHPEGNRRRRWRLTASAGHAPDSTNYRRANKTPRMKNSSSGALVFIIWRPRSELNRRTRICSPLHNHSATRPDDVSDSTTSD